MGLFQRFRRWITGQAVFERTLVEYEKAFPERCGLCAYQRYGLREFGIKIGPLPPHHCPEHPERKSVWERLAGEDVI